MAKPSTSQDEIHLNPFAFPSETDIRFLLLVLVIAGSTMTMTQAVVGIFTTSTLISVSCALVATISLFMIARNQAQKSALRMIKANRWQFFPPKVTDPLLSTSHQQMDRYIQETLAKVPELASEKLQFVWDETSKASKLPTGMAFGFGKHQYVCLRQGLHDAFIQFPKSSTFRSVLMHELGHIANRDVSKTIFTTSLGRCFFPIAILSLMIFTFYTLWEVVSRIQREIPLDSAQPGIQEIINTNIKLTLLLLIVEIARSSILRVREFYADIRARIWLGNSVDLTQLLSEHLGGSSQKYSKQNSKNQRSLLAIWEFLKHSFRNRVAPLHPTSRQRIMRLRNPHVFFSPNYETAFLAGFLSGISINTNISILNILQEITIFTDRLNQNFQMADETTFPVLLIALFFFILSLFFFAIFFAVFVVFGLVPIVGIVGLQIQQAAFADRAQPQQLQLLSLQKLMTLSLVLGISFVLGCLLSPFVHALSMRTAEASIPWVGILGLAVGWATIFFVWALSLVQFARSLYLNHIEPSIPHQKRRWLTCLSGILLFPLFLWMCMVQIFFGAQAVNPALASTSTLVVGSIISGGFTFALYGVICLIGWRIGAAKGWFSKPKCPHCQSVINNQFGLPKHCHKCDHSVSSWTWPTDPISFPIPPTSSIPVTTAPPLSF